MRGLSVFFGSGIVDRYSNIRYCVLDSAFGGLSFWGARMDDRAI